MSDIVDQRIIEMEFDNSRFQKNAQDTIKALDNLDNQINETVENNSQALINLSDGLNKMELVIAGFYERIGEYVADIGIKILDMGKNFVKSMTTDQLKEGFNKYTAETLAAQTVVSTAADKIAEAYGIIGSPEEIEEGVMKKTYEALENIALYADETSYSVGNLQDTMSKMVMGGTDLEDAVTAVKGIGNWAAVTGAGIDKANAVMPALVKSFNAGYVRLRDWQSVQANSMADPTFVEKLLNYARQYSDEMREWEEINGKLDYNNYMEYAFGNNKWISSEALIATLAEYGDTTTEIGAKGKAAAAEAKTLSEALGAVKDAVSSGWSLSFRYLFGDYKEARRFFTVIQDSLIDLFTIGQEFRNQVLGTWHDLGGFDDIVDAMENLWEGVKALAKPIGDAFHEIFGLEDVDAAAKKLKDFTGKIKDAAVKFKEFYTKPSEIFEIIDRIKNGELDQLPDDLKEKYTNLLGDPSKWGINTAEQLDRLLFGSWYKGSDVQNAHYILSDIKDAFEGIFSIVKTGKDVLSGFGTLCKNIFSNITRLVKPVLELAGSLGRYIARVRETLEESKLLDRFWQSLIKIANSALGPAIDLVTKALKWLATEIDKTDTHFLKQAFDKLGTAIEKVANIISGALSQAFEWLEKKVDKIKEVLEPLKKAFNDIFETISESIGKKFGSGQTSRFETFLEGAGTALGTFADFLFNNAVIPALETLADLFVRLLEAAKPLGTAFEGAFSKIGAVFSMMGNKKEAEDTGGALSGVFSVLSDIVTFITEKAVVPILQGLADVISDLCDKTTPLGDIFSKAWQGIKEFFTNIFSVFNSGTKDAGNTGVITTFLGNVGTTIGTVFTWFAQLFNNIYENIKDAVDRLKGLGFKDIVNIIKTVLGIFTQLAAGKMMFNIGDFFGSAADLLNGLNIFGNAIKNTKGAADIIIDVGKSLLMFAAALFIISGIDKEKLTAAADTVSSFIDSLVQSIIAINMSSAYWNINIGAFNGLKANGANLFASNILDLALAILVIAFALKKLAESDISKEKMEPALDAIRELMEIIAGIEVVMSVASGTFTRQKGFFAQQYKGGTAGDFKGILAFAISVWLLSKALINLANKANPETLKKSADVIAEIIGVLAAAFIAVNLLSRKLSKASGGLNLTVTMNTTLLQLALVIGAITAAIYVLSNYVKGDDSLIVATSCLAGLALMLVVLGKAAKEFKASVSNILVMYSIVGVIAAMAGVLAILNTLDPKNVAYGLLELVAGFLLLAGVAKTAKYLANSIGDLAVGIVAMYAITGVMAAMAGVLAILNTLDTAKTAESLLILAGAFGLLFAAAWIASLDPIANGLKKLGDSFLKFGLAILAGGVGIYAVAKGFQLIVDVLVNGVPQIQNSAGSIFITITTLLAMAIAAVSEFIPAIMGMVVGILVGIIVSIAESADLIINSVVLLLNNLGVSIDEHSDEIGEAVARLLVAILKAVWSFLKNLAFDLLEWFGVEKQEVKDFFANIWKSITDWFKNAWNWIVNIPKKIQDFFEMIDKKVSDAIEDLGKDINDWLIRQWEAITGWISNLWDGIKNVWNKIVGIFNPNTAENQQAIADATTLGKNIANGMSKGVTDGSSAARTAASYMARQTIKAAEYELAIESPSKVFQRIGRYVDEGFAKGIDDNTFVAISATEELANGSVSAMQEALNEIASLDLTGASDPVIRPVLDLSEIQNGARNIGSFFGNRYSLGLATSAVSGVTGSDSSFGNVFNFTICGEGQSAQTIADEVMNKINMELRSRSSVWR